MLVLLVIFMVTAPLVSPGEIALPSVGSRLTVPVAPLEVTLRNDQSLWLRDQSTPGTSAVRVSRDELVARVVAKQARTPDQGVVIAADKAARYEDVLVGPRPAPAQRRAPGRPARAAAADLTAAPAMKGERRSEGSAARSTGTQARARARDPRARGVPRAC